MTAPPAEPTATDRLLRRRARVRRAVACCAGVIAATAVLGNVWQQVRGGDDWGRFDRRSFVVLSVMSGDRISVEELEGGRTAIVELLGVDAPDMPAKDQPPPHGAIAAYHALRDRLHGRTVMLKLLPLDPRAGGAVRAYVHLDGAATTVNEQLVADGLAYADRRVPHPVGKQFEQAEAEARRRRAGLWADVRDDQQPAWRQDWVRRQREGRGG